MGEVRVEVHVQPDGKYRVTSNGLRRFARPEIEVAFVRDDELDDAQALVEHVAKWLMTRPQQGACVVRLRGIADDDPVLVGLQEHRAEPASFYGQVLGISERRVMRVVDVGCESARPDRALRAIGSTRRRPVAIVLP